MTLKERLERSRSTLGAAKSDGVVTALKAKLGHFPTLRQQAEALERESGPAGTARPQSFSGNISALELCTQYDALTSAEQRRAFCSTHRKAISSKIGGLAEICMAAGKRLSSRARTSVGLPSLDQRASELLEEYKKLDHPKDRAHFWLEHRETLEKSKFAAGTFLNFIAAGKSLSGRTLAVFGMMKEQETEK